MQVLLPSCHFVPLGQWWNGPLGLLPQLLMYGNPGYKNPRLFGHYLYYSRLVRPFQWHIIRTVTWFCERSPSAKLGRLGVWRRFIVHIPFHSLSALYITRRSPPVVSHLSFRIQCPTQKDWLAKYVFLDGEIQFTVWSCRTLPDPDLPTPLARITSCGCGLHTACFWNWCAEL